jgi:hypothetical protein
MQKEIVIFTSGIVFDYVALNEVFINGSLSHKLYVHLFQFAPLPLSALIYVYACFAGYLKATYRYLSLFNVEWETTEHEWREEGDVCRDLF